MLDLKKRKPGDLSAYEAVVLGTGVRMTMVYRKGKSFLARNDLRDKKLGVFLSSGMAIEDPEKARRRFLDPLIHRNALEPLQAAAFPGKMPGEKGRLEDKSDPEAARKWAESLAGRLAG